MTSCRTPGRSKASFGLLLGLVLVGEIALAGCGAGDSLASRFGNRSGGPRTEVVRFSGSQRSLAESMSGSSHVVEGRVLSIYDAPDNSDGSGSRRSHVIVDISVESSYRGGHERDQVVKVWLDAGTASARSGSSYPAPRPIQVGDELLVFSDGGSELPTLGEVLVPRAESGIGIIQAPDDTHVAGLDGVLGMQNVLDEVAQSGSDAPATTTAPTTTTTPRTTTTAAPPTPAPTTTSGVPVQPGEVGMTDPSAFVGTNGAAVAGAPPPAEPDHGVGGR